MGTWTLRDACNLDFNRQAPKPRRLQLKPESSKAQYPKSLKHSPKPSCSKRKNERMNANMRHDMI